jgi:phosphoglycolate phosphatase-like HAD superfamily hydrolase
VIRHLEATPKVHLAAEKRRIIKALIFDFDGTLVDFVESDIASLKYIYRLTGINHGEDVFIERAISNIIHFHELVDKGEVDPETMHRYRLFNTFKELGLQWDEFYVDRYKRKTWHNYKCL